MDKKIIKILLANDNKLVRQGIRKAISSIAPHIQIVEEAEDFQGLLTILSGTEFDILMSDDIMQGENILTYLPGFKDHYPNLKIIINSIFTEEVPHLKKSKEWTNGWLSYSLSLEDYVDAIESVYGGGHYYYKVKEN